MSQSQVLGKIFKRTFIIFLCGFLLYWFPFFHTDEAHHIVFLLFHIPGFWAFCKELHWLIVLPPC